MTRHMLEVAASRHVQRTHRVCRRFSEPSALASVARDTCLREVDVQVEGERVVREGGVGGCEHGL